MRFALLLVTIAGYMDAYAMVIHGAFAAAQTGNLVFIVIGLVEGTLDRHVLAIWSVAAFLAGTVAAVAVDRRWTPHETGHHALRWLLAAQTLLIAAVGLIPESAPQPLAIVPLVMISGMLFELFRKAEGHKYIPVTMTGNLVRLVESAYATFVERAPGSRSALIIDAAVIGCYLTGALCAGACVKLAGARSIWIAAAAMIVLLSFFVLDDRRGVRD